MSNQATASAASTGAATRPAATAKKSVWQTMFHYWLLSYSNRIDANGNVFCEL